MIGMKRLALLKHGAPPRNVLEAALRAKWGGGGGVSYEKTVGPAPIISISDAKAKPAKSLIVGMEPIQDLHGYDSPWPAGGGVNKIDFSKCTANRTAFGLTSAISGEHFRFTGTCSSGDAHTWVFGTVDIEQRSIIETLSLKGFVISGGSALSITEIAYNSSTGALSVTLGGLVTGTVYDFSIGIVAYDGTAPTAWSPYSNECPISGRTGVTVERTGKNLLDNRTWLNKGGYWYTGTDYSTRLSIPMLVPVFPSTRYTISRGAGELRYAVQEYNNTGKSGATNPYLYDSGWRTLDSFTFTTTAETHYVWVVLSSPNYSYDILPADGVAAKIQIELCSTASPYEPYVGASFPVVFPDGQTVYGCTVDVVTGVLTATMAMVDLGSLNWYADTNRPGVFYTAGISGIIKKVSGHSAYLVCSQYKLRDAGIPSAAKLSENDCQISSQASYGGGYVYVIDTSHANDSKDTFKTAMSGVQLCYELATPITYQLTPTQIQMLKGVNVLWSDADALTLTYFGTTPANLLGGMLGGGFGVGYTPPAEEPEDEEQVPEEEQAEESDPEEVIPGGE